jgi:hypothetical protein
VREVFAGFESGSIQQIIYQIGEKMLADIPVDRRDSSGSEQPHLGYDRRSKAIRSAFTPTRGLLTDAWDLR